MAIPSWISFRLLLIAVTTVSVLTACVTTYQQDSLTGGYSDLPLGGHKYQVTVKYNAYTSETRGKEIGLVRSADLALQAGFHGFYIVSVAPITGTGYLTTPVGRNTSAMMTTAMPYQYGFVFIIEVTNNPDAISAADTIRQYGEVVGRSQSGDSGGSKEQGTSP